METPFGPGAATLVDTLLILSRALPRAKAEEMLEGALDTLLAGTSTTRGAAFVAGDEALDLVAGRGITPGLEAVLQRLPLTSASWFVAQRAAESRLLVMDRVIAPADRAVFAHARWEQMVACPVAAGGEVFGVIVIAWPDVEQPDERVLATVEIACHMTALELARRDRPEARAARSFWPSDARPAARAQAPAPATSPRRAPTEPAMPAARLPDAIRREAPNVLQSHRQEELSALSRAAADTLRREGPKEGAAVIAMLRERGVSEQEALAVLTFALSTGTVVRGPPPSTVLRASEPRTVLIVDDDHELRETLSEILNDEGYTVATATNGREALDMLRRRDAPRVVVLDLMMPVMDGWQLLEELRRDEALSRIPVIIMSASNSVPRAAGTSDILAKPVDYYRLLTSVERSASGPTTPT